MSLIPVFQRNGVKQMYSKRLKQHGLENQIFGSDYNFRTATKDNDLISQVNHAIKEMGIKPIEVYSCHQKHTNTVQYADGVNGKPFIVGRIFEESDGLVTDGDDIALLIKFADCTPVVLFDPVQRVQAIVHSGWRGTAEKISVKALDQMISNLSCRKEDIIAFVGPSIDQENYEVGSEVYEAFEHIESRDTFFKQTGEKYLMDMSAANVQLLLDAGINENQIEISKETTYTNDNLHSARKEGTDYQLNAMITMMKS